MVCAYSLSHVFLTPWTVAHQASLSMGFSRQEHWSGLPFPSPGDLPSPGIEPGSPAQQAGSLLLSHLGSPSSVANCVEPAKHAFLPHPRYSERNNNRHSLLSTVYQVFLRCICLSKIDLPAFYAFILATNKHLEKDGSRDRSALNFWTPWRPQIIKQQMAAWCYTSEFSRQSPVPSAFHHQSQQCESNCRSRAAHRKRVPSNPNRKYCTLMCF